MKRAVLACVATLTIFLAGGPALAGHGLSTYTNKKGTWGKQEFFEILGKGTTELFRSGPVKTANQNYNTIDPPEEVQTQAPEGAWKLSMHAMGPLLGSNNGASANFGKVMVYTLPVLVENYGDSFQFTFLSEPVMPYLWDATEKEMASNNKSIVDKYDDMKVQIARKDDTFAVTATFPYGEGVSESKVIGRLDFLFKSTNSMITFIKDAENKAMWKAFGTLKNEKLTALSRDEFLVLVNEVSGYEAKNNVAKEGSWKWGLKSGTVWVDNTGTELDMWLAVPAPSELSQEKKDQILSKVTTKVNKDPAEGSASGGAQWIGDAVWVKFAYPYDGKLTGKDLIGRYNDFTYKYAKNLYDDCAEIVDKNK